MPLPGSSPADVPFRPARWGTAFPSSPGPLPSAASAARATRAPRGSSPGHGRGPAAADPPAWAAPGERGRRGRSATAAGHAAPGPSPAGERLWRLAEDIDASQADGPPGDGVVLFLRAPGVDAPGGAEVDLGWQPLDGRHPLDVLLGLRAPEEWQAVGISCSGGVVPVDTAPPRGGRGHRSRSAVRITTFLDRAGRSASVLRTDGRARRLDEAPEGAVGDSLRRVLGLPTAPPPATTAPFWVAWWLDRIVDHALGGRPPATWAEVARLHPACPFSLPGRGPRPVTLARAAADLADRWPWHRLRTDAAVAHLRAPAAQGEGVGPGIPGLPAQADAAWMDDGMFARWLFGALPMLPDLLDACRSVLPVVLYDEVGEVVEATLRLHASTPPPPPAWPTTEDDDDVDDGGQAQPFACAHPLDDEANPQADTADDEDEPTPRPDRHEHRAPGARRGAPPDGEEDGLTSATDTTSTGAGNGRMPGPHGDVLPSDSATSPPAGPSDVVGPTGDRTAAADAGHGACACAGLHRSGGTGRRSPEGTPGSGGRAGEAPG